MMAGAAIAAMTLAILAVLSVRADAHFSDHAKLPMQFGPDGSPGWTLSRRWALCFTPGLAVLILIPTVWVGAGSGAVLFAGLCLIAGHRFHLWLVDRTVRKGGT